MKWLPDCFGSILKQDYKNYEIIFVDNASSDHSVQWVKKQYPKTKIIVNDKNLGFSHANNIGWRYASGEYVLFLNNDTSVTKTFLTELVSFLKKDVSLGGMQSKILLMDHPDTLDSVGAFLTPIGFLFHFGFGNKDVRKYDKDILLYTAKGACMLFRKSVLDKVTVDGNIFDPDYFAYFEETDLCHRIWLAGYSIGYNYRSVIYHKMGATSSTIRNASIQYHSFKNRINSYIKNCDVAHLLSILPLHIVFCEVFAVASIALGRFDLTYAIEKAILWNVVNISKTLRKRRIIQKSIRTRPDSAFWQNIFRKPRLVYYWYLFKGSSDYEESV
jgi:hypothetical protein